MSVWELVAQGDGVSRFVAAVLLLMSVASWVVILWKAWLLRRVGQDARRGLAMFWQSPGLDAAALRVAALDREQVLTALIDAARAQAPDTLAGAGERKQQLTRALRDALHTVLRRLQFGQTLLATVGSTAPFVGLLGTVWGIYHALLGLGTGGAMTLDRLATPVGEALIMTAAGLAVAIPAVLAYNILGRVLSQLEAELEGFARDLRDLVLSLAVPAAV